MCKHQSHAQSGPKRISSSSDPPLILFLLAGMLVQVQDGDGVVLHSGHHAGQQRVVQCRACHRVVPACLLRRLCKHPAVARAGAGRSTAAAAAGQAISGVAVLPWRDDDRRQCSVAGSDCVLGARRRASAVTVRQDVLPNDYERETRSAAGRRSIEPRVLVCEHVRQRTPSAGTRTNTRL